MNDPRPPGANGGIPNARRPGRGWAIAGIVSGVLALGILPIVLGPLGILLGIVGYAKGSRRMGVVAIVAGALGLVIGLVLTFVLLSAVG